MFHHLAIVGLVDYLRLLQFGSIEPSPSLYALIESVYHGLDLLLGALYQIRYGQLFFDHTDTCATEYFCQCKPYASAILPGFTGTYAQTVRR